MPVAATWSSMEVVAKVRKVGSHFGEATAQRHLVGVLSRTRASPSGCVSVLAVLAACGAPRTKEDTVRLLEVLPGPASARLA
jgi:hypothetical protein